jgi:hypothetical protein
MTTAYPHLANPYTLSVAAYDVLGSGTGPRSVGFWDQVAPSAGMSPFPRYPIVRPSRTAC